MNLKYLLIATISVGAIFFTYLISTSGTSGTSSSSDKEEGKRTTSTESQPVKRKSERLSTVGGTDREGVTSNGSDMRAREESKQANSPSVTMSSEEYRMKLNKLNASIAKIGGGINMQLEREHLQNVQKMHDLLITWVASDMSEAEAWALENNSRIQLIQAVMHQKNFNDQNVEDATRLVREIKNKPERYTTTRRLVDQIGGKGNKYSKNWILSMENEDKTFRQDATLMVIEKIAKSDPEGARDLAETITDKVTREKFLENILTPVPRQKYFQRVRAY